LLDGVTTKLKDLTWQGFELSEINQDGRSLYGGIVENEVEGRSLRRKIINKLVKKP
jgi:hypothetical protein